MARSFTREVTVQALGGAGDGVAESGGERYYIPFSVPGDRIEIRVGRNIGTGFKAELLALLEPGPGRREAPCRHFQSCGGCALQHVEDGAYAEWKRQQVEAALRRRDIALEVQPIVRVPAEDRRRMDLVARKVGGGVILGLHEADSHRIVDLGECRVARPEIVAALPALRALLAKLELPARGVDIRVNLLDGGLDLLLVGPLTLDLAVRESIAAFAARPGIARLSLMDGDSDTPETLATVRPATMTIDEVLLAPPPGAFLQASAAAEAALALAVSEGVGGAGAIVDLYAGIGTFALRLARNAKVHAVEGDAAALAALKSAADRAGRPVTVERRDLTRAPLMADELRRFDAAVFDPPRAGAREQAVELAKSRIQRIVAVSCAPGSFARDARLLIDGGYRLRHVRPVDQFLWSAHIELVALFER